MANNTELNTGPFIWGAAQNAAGQPDDTIARTGPDISRETFMDDTFRAFMLLYRSGVWHKGMNADLLDGQHADEFQPICATLTALCALSSYGLVAKTAADTIAARTITASATAGREGIAITNGDGVSGNPEVGLNISGLTADTTLNATDEFPYRDATSEGNNKIDASNLAAQLAVLGGYATTATAVTAASAFAAANRILMSAGADRTSDDTTLDFSGNVISFGAASTAGIRAGLGQQLTLGTTGEATSLPGNVTVGGTLASGAHTVDIASPNAVARSVGEDSTTGPWRDEYPVEFRVSSSSATFDIATATDTGYIVELDLIFLCNTAGAPYTGGITQKAVFENAGGTVNDNGDLEGPTTLDPHAFGVTAVLSASGTNIRLTVTDSSGNTMRVRGMVFVTKCGNGA